jgi:ribosome recycling factor
MFSFSEMRGQCDKLLEVFRGDLSTIRTGRAKPALVEGVMVEAYGGMMKLMELASITAPDSSMIVIKPWDKSLLGAIEKGIQMSELHLNPVTDSEQVRLNIPPLTGERREELVKLVSQKRHMSEEMLRDIRTKFKKQIDGQKGQPGISEDAIKRDLDELQKLTDEYGKKIADIASAKETELRQ